MVDIGRDVIGCRANAGYISGRVYFEAEVMDDGLARVGWSGISGQHVILAHLHSWR